jgi:hypothetical protein
MSHNVAIPRDDKFFGGILPILEDTWNKIVYYRQNQDKLEELLIITDEELLFWESIGVSPTYMFEDYGIADEFSYDIKTQRSISQ